MNEPVSSVCRAAVMLHGKMVLLDFIVYTTSIPQS